MQVLNASHPQKQLNKCLLQLYLLGDFLSLTYSIIIRAVDISPTVNKILHYTFTTSFWSSHMQGSHLMKR